MAIFELEPLSIRPAVAADRADLVAAIVELQDFERALHDSRLPGAELAEPYLRALERGAADGGAILVARCDASFVGFVAGWIELDEAIAETEESRRFGYVSDICVLAAYRRRGVASRLLAAIERQLADGRVTRIRINALAANAAALACYRRAGFSPYEVLMEKRVRIDLPSRKR